LTSEIEMISKMLKIFQYNFRL